MAFNKVEEGEWNVLHALGDGRYRKQGGGGKGRLDRGPMADLRLDSPLPWDHIDTGISKIWLKTDLQRALEVRKTFNDWFACPFNFLPY